MNHSRYINVINSSEDLDLSNSIVRVNILDLLGFGSLATYKVTGFISFAILSLSLALSMRYSGGSFKIDVPKGHMIWKNLNKSGEIALFAQDLHIYELQYQKVDQSLSIYFRTLLQ